MRLLAILSVLSTLSAATFAATLTGRILEDRSGAALPSVDIRVFRTGTPGVTAELETDGGGRFSVDQLPEGDYRIEVSKPNHIPATLRTRLTEAQPSDLLLRLLRCGVIGGRVLDGSGQAVRGATVYAMRAGSGSLRPDRSAGQYATSDAAGRYRLFNLAPGQYIIAVSYGASTLQVGSTGSAASVAGLGSGVQFFPANARPQTFTVSSGDQYQNVDFAILPSTLYSVSGKVDTTAVPSASVGRFWLALAPTEQPAVAVAAATAEQDGTFRFTGIPPGAYELFVSGPSRGRSGLGAELEDGALFARTRVSVGSQDVANLALTPEKSRSVTVLLKAPFNDCSGSGQLTISSVEDWGANLERRSPLPVNTPQTITRMAPARYRLSVAGLGEKCHVLEGATLDLTTRELASPVVITASSAGAIHGSVPGGSTDLTVVLADLTDRTLALQFTSLDAGARFVFGPLRPGRYRLSARNRNASESRWMDEHTGGVEVDVLGGAPMRITIPAPVQP